jgi:hypothetical protein
VGTLTWHKPKGVKAVDAIKQSIGAEWWDKHVVASTATREAVFLVVERHDPASTIYVPDTNGMTRGLAVLKLSIRPREHYNFGYKDMDEASGPCGCEAPMSILAQCSALQPVTAETPEGSLTWATAYRDRCAKLAAAKALKRGLKPGDKVTLAKPGQWAGATLQNFTVERTRVRGRKGVSTVFRADNGMLCGITAAQLDGAIVSTTNQ